jgi:hypothetical protein
MKLISHLVKIFTLNQLKIHINLERESKLISKIETIFRKNAVVL